MVAYAHHGVRGDALHGSLVFHLDPGRAGGELPFLPPRWRGPRPFGGGIGGGRSSSRTGDFWGQIGGPGPRVGPTRHPCPGGVALRCRLGPEMTSLWPRIEPLLAPVTKPPGYIGGELGVREPVHGPGRVAWLLVYPDTYEIGLPNQGL